MIFFALCKCRHMVYIQKWETVTVLTSEHCPYLQQIKASKQTNIILIITVFLFNWFSAIKWLKVFNFQQGNCTRKQFSVINDRSLPVWRTSWHTVFDGYWRKHIRNTANSMFMMRHDALLGLKHKCFPSGSFLEVENWFAAKIEWHLICGTRTSNLRPDAQCIRAVGTRGWPAKLCLA